MVGVVVDAGVVAAVVPQVILLASSVDTTNIMILKKP